MSNATPTPAPVDTAAEAQRAAELLAWMRATAPEFLSPEHR